jgi:hypothetical protein
VQTDPERDLGELLLHRVLLELSAGHQHSQARGCLVQAVVLPVLGVGELLELSAQGCQAVARVVPRAS